MPNPTFFNLPESKRQRLMNAVWQEFTSVSYIDASINKIIQNADISRGSFYQYFSGKADVFTYALGTILAEAKQLFSAQLTAHNNDLFDAILGVYELLLWTQSRKQKHPGAERLHTLIRLNAELDMSQFAEYMDCSTCTRQIQNLLMQTGYILHTPLECQALFHMLTTICLSNMADTLRHPNHETHNRQLLEQQLDLIRRGLPHTEQEGAATC